MKLQTYMIDVTRAAAEEAFRYAKQFPEDKLDWKPDEKGRSALDLCRELAMCPEWAADIIKPGAKPDWSSEAASAGMEEANKLMQSWTTVEACHEECKKRLDALFDLYANMPDERLSETQWLPFDGGRDFTMPEMMDYPRWNFTYHTGQLAYIQTLYGDTEMH